MVPLSPKARAALCHLLHAASETLHDGTYYLPADKRNSQTVREAEGAFHEFTKQINNGLLSDMKSFEASLERMHDILSRMAAKGVEPTTLMVHRDYASATDHKQAQKRNRRPQIKLRPQPRLIWPAD